MKHLFNWIFTILISITSISCKDVIEEDILDKKVILNSPPDKYVFTSSSVNFWWGEVEGANDYILQIVSPQFNYIEELILDSTIDKNKFGLILNPGNYQWKVIAKNSSESISSSIWSFSVDSVKDIKDVVIDLISPAENEITKDGIMTFTWQGHPLVEDFRYEVRSPDRNGSLLFPAVLTTSTVFTNTDFELEDGIYEWGVQGQSASSNTAFSYHRLTVDNTAPASPILNLPQNNGNLTGGNVTFSWNRPSDAGTKVMDSLFIYSESSLSTLARPVQLLEEQTYSDSLPGGTFFWRVRSFDKAGNLSNYSSTWSFTMTQ